MTDDNYFLALHLHRYGSYGWMDEWMDGLLLEKLYCWAATTT